jgi:hypothetical protein
MNTTSASLLERVRRPTDQQGCERLVDLYTPLLYFWACRTGFQPATWKACWEFVVAGKPAAEVAAQLGISIDSVYATKSRVLRRLRQELHGLLD